jgi:hypothetical protein
LEVAAGLEVILDLFFPTNDSLLDEYLEDYVMGLLGLSY